MKFNIILQCFSHFFQSSNSFAKKPFPVAPCRIELSLQKLFNAFLVDALVQSAVVVFTGTSIDLQMALNLIGETKEDNLKQILLRCVRLVNIALMQLQ